MHLPAGFVTPDAAYLVGARQRTTGVHRRWSRQLLLRGSRGVGRGRARGRNMTCSGNPAHLDQPLAEKVRQALAGAAGMPVPRAAAASGICEPKGG